MQFKIRSLGPQTGHRTNASTSRVRGRRARRPGVEVLEGRALMAITSVTTVWQNSATQYDRIEPPQVFDDSHATNDSGVSAPYVQDSNHLQNYNNSDTRTSEMSGTYNYMGPYNQPVEYSGTSTLVNGVQLSSTVNGTQNGITSGELKASFTSTVSDTYDPKGGFAPVPFYTAGSTVSFTIDSDTDGHLTVRYSGNMDFQRFRPDGTELPPSAGGAALSLSSDPYTSDGTLWYGLQETAYNNSQSGSIRIPMLTVQNNYPFPHYDSYHSVTININEGLNYPIAGDSSGNGQGSADLQWQFTPTLPSITMTKATTLDSRSVTVDYNINNSDLTQPLTLDVYRSSSPTEYGSDDELTTDTISTSDLADLSAGPHEVTIGLGSDKMQPDPSRPYIVVVAASTGLSQVADNGANPDDSAYFQIHLLGAVVHGGFNFPGVPASLGSGTKGRVRKLLRSWQRLERSLPGFAAWANKDAWAGWVTPTADALVSVDKYDDAIPFNWAIGSILPTSGQTEQAGMDLADKIVARADQLAQQHSGDIVDLHLIGHSRGAVVISQALLDLLKTTDPALEGSFVRMTLLDPHPARTFNGITHVDYSSNRLGRIARKLVDFVHREDQDPLVRIPPNVDYAESYVERTPLNELSGLEKIFNLYGGTEQDGTVVNESATPLHVSILTSKMLSDGEYIGHTEVRLWYQEYVVAGGRSLQPTQQI